MVRQLERRQPPLLPVTPTVHPRYTPDLYGRILGKVFLDGHNGNLEMIKAAPAEVYRGKPAPGQGTGPYWKAEEEARKENRGM